VRPIKEILEHYPVKKRVVRGLAHITGEGLPATCRACYRREGACSSSAAAGRCRRCFRGLQKLGNIDQKEMETVFNMGIGFVVVVSRYYAESIQRRLEELRVPAYLIGEVREGESGVEFE